ncbi:CPBP family intramembrane glutamic endopeptidase [Nocardia sp. NPDC051030]|uniref:CPBP family intramembrane glutamic endopeptidase n=1 Tax=Nocardia sp. NPDC051030 TaxID=3155162 RepID=UPI0034308197
MIKHPERRERWILIGVFLAVVLPAMIGFGLTGAPILVVFAMPSVVALALTAVSPHRRAIAAGLGIRRTSPGSVGVAVAAAIVPIAVGVLVLVACRLDHLPPVTQWLLPIGAWHVLSGIRQGVFEEIGWRGFLQPQLSALLDVRKAVVFTGLAWAVFHYGLIIGDGPPNGLSLWLYLPIFTATLVAVSVYAGYLRQLTGSVGPAVALHAANNIAGGYADQLLISVTHPAMAELLGDTVGLACWLVPALWAWPRLRRIDSSNPGKTVERTGNS